MKVEAPVIGLNIWRMLQVCVLVHVILLLSYQ